MLQWILDKDVPRGASNDTVIERLLALYFIGMHTTIMVRYLRFSVRCFTVP